MRTLSKKIILFIVAASVFGAAHAASPAGLKLQKVIYGDSAEIGLRTPEGVACDERGALVVADTGNARLLTYSFKDGALSGGTQVKVPQLSYPVRVQIDSKGFVFALDRRARRIVKIDEKGAFAGYVEPKGSSGAVTPSAFKIGPADAMVVLDVAGKKVVVLDSGARVTRELPLPKAAGITDVAIDSQGRVYVVDAVTAVVFVAEAGATAFVPLSKSLKDQVSFPTYIAPDNRGKLYLVDQNGSAIVRLGIDGSFQGRDLSMGSTEGAIYYPAQLCFTSGGDLFLADRNNHRVQIFAMPR